MAKAEIRVVLDDKKLRQLARELGESAEDILKVAAFSIEGHAKANAPVDTSALRNSIYTLTAKGSYEGKRPINGDLPDLGFPLTSRKTDRVVTYIEQGPLPEPKRNEAHIGPSVEYGLYVELGANGRAGQPFLEPAVATVATSGIFAKAVRQVLKSYE